MSKYQNVKHYLSNQGINFPSMKAIMSYVNYHNGYDEADEIYDEPGYMSEYLISKTNEAFADYRFIDAACYASALADNYEGYCG